MGNCHLRIVKEELSDIADPVTSTFDDSVKFGIIFHDWVIVSIVLYPSYKSALQMRDWTRCKQ